MSVEDGAEGGPGHGFREREGTDASFSSRVARPPLASLLAEAGVASEEQLRLAVAEGMGSGERLGEVVLRRGWIDEAGLARVLARQWELPFVDEEPVAIDARAAALLPAEERERLGACAIGFVEGMPVIAVAEPTEERFEAVRARLGMDCRFAVVTKGMFERLRTGQASADAQLQAEQASLAAGRAAEEAETELLVAELDRATASVVAVRARVEQLAQRQQGADRELAELRAQLDALNDTRASEQTRLQSLERELARQRELVAAARAKLAEVVRMLEGG